MSNHQLDLVQDFCDRIHLSRRWVASTLDQPAAQIDWATLKQTFVQADAQARDEWGDADESF
jgi:ABC-type phosphate/phosphonate transport system ATPase subunit